MFYLSDFTVVMLVVIGHVQLSPSETLCIFQGLMYSLYVIYRIFYIMYITMKCFIASHTHTATGRSLRKLGEFFGDNQVPLLHILS